MNKFISLIAKTLPLKHNHLFENLLSSNIPDLKNNDILDNSSILFDFFHEVYPENDLSIDVISKAQCEVNKIINLCNDHKIQIIGHDEPNFPVQLKQFKGMPFYLFFKGDISILNKLSSIAVIGTRTPTPHGEKVAERFGEFLAENNIITISGLAKGCDSAAHQGCLNKNGLTIAVLGNGLDKIYPKENLKLSDAILSSGGCIISEYPPLSVTRKIFFVERDRIVSALSKGVIVVEASLKSGTMHTVQFAQRQKRLIGVYKHSDKFKNLKQVIGNLNLLQSPDIIPLRDYKSIVDFIELLNSKKTELNHNHHKNVNLFNIKGDIS